MTSRANEVGCCADRVDDAEQNPNQPEAWLGSPPAVNGSPSANNRGSSGRKVIEGGPAVKVRIQLYYTATDDWQSRDS